MSLGGGQQTGAPSLVSSNTAGNSSQNSNINTSNGTSNATTTDMGPWGAQQPFLMGGFGNASSLLNNNSQPLGMNSFLSGGLQNTANAAGGAIQNYLNPATNYNNSVLAGNFLSPNSNPYLAASVQAAEQPIMNNYQTAIAPGIASNSEMANRYGSGEANQQTNQAQTALLNNLSNTSANMYSGAYNQGIGQMNQAAQLAPGLMQASFMPGQMLTQAGQQMQGFQQAQQMYPWLTAQMYQSLVGGNYGTSGGSTQFGNQTGNQTGQQTGTTQGTMTGQQQQAYNSNPFGQALGGGIGLLGALGQAGGSAGIAGLFA